MTDIHVEPADPAPETVSLGCDDDRGLVARLLDHPRLRALRGRRMPYSVVAVASAAIAGTAVAVYMDRPVEMVEATPPLTRVILEPESWVNVLTDESPPPVPSGAELERLLAGHPPEATVTLPLGRYRESLVGLPPGTYRVQASCSAETVTPPAGQADPVWFSIEIFDPASYESAPESAVDRDLEMICDRDPYTVSGRMTTTGYQAVAVYYASALDELETYVGDLLVVVSFTPVS